MSRAEQKKVKFHFHTGGSPDKPPVIFLHGFMGSSEDWKKVIRYVSTDYYCLAIDLPGHGKTDLPDELTFESAAVAILEFLKHHKIRKCIPVGYSMGGRLALFLALRYPGHFKRVVLESTSPGLRTNKEREARIKSDEEIAWRLESGDFHSFLIQWYRQPLFEGLTRNRNFDKLLQLRLENDPKKLARSLQIFGTGNQPSLWEELHQCKIPILLLAGAADKKYRLIAEEMSRSSQLIQTKIVGKCSHNIHFQQPERLADCIKEFFAQD